MLGGQIDSWFKKAIKHILNFEHILYLWESATTKPMCFYSMAVEHWEHSTEPTLLTWKSQEVATRMAEGGVRKWAEQGRLVPVCPLDNCVHVPSHSMDALELCLSLLGVVGCSSVTASDLVLKQSLEATVANTIGLRMQQRWNSLFSWR